MLVRSSWRAYSKACIRLRPSRLSQASSRSFPPGVHRCFTPGGSIQQHKIQGNVDDVTATKEVRERQQELQRASLNPYPRLSSTHTLPGTSLHTISSWPHPLERSKSVGDPALDQQYPLPAAGRIVSIRHSGKKLVFFDLTTDQRTMQLTLNYDKLPPPAPTTDEFHQQCRLLRRGDHISVQATPILSRDGKPALQALSMPVLQSPCLQRLPVFGTDLDHPTERHVHMLAAPGPIQSILVRSNLNKAIRDYFTNDGFVEVVTPILTANAGGAIARPFETTASEFPGRKLALRVAPELWLKKLVVGGMTRIFEIGPCFRNEGLDKTHNPEFHTCEFYAAYLSLPELKATTQKLLHHVVSKLQLDELQNGPIDAHLGREIMSGADKPNSIHENSGFPVIDFIPALNTLIGVELPNLASPTARENLLNIFHIKEISLPDKPTLPRLLDKLSSQFLEPHCQAPTWIENIPECLSPLAKSFIHPTAPNEQPVAARAELFMRGKEVVNCYEEENDPFEQRRKFIEQQIFARDPDSGEIDEEAMIIDEEYIRALEWGLPPTGGWGMGIDRLLMLLLGKDKIADVLTFGNLRAVTRGAEKWEEIKSRENSKDGK